MDKTYVVENDSSQEYTVIDSDENFNYCVLPIHIIKVKKEKCYSNKDDSMYSIFRSRRRQGVALKNFSKSKYFPMYLRRARVEDPELLI